MKRILFCLLAILMVQGLVSAQLDNYAAFPKNTGASVRADIVVTSLTNGLQKDIIVSPDNREIFVFNSDGTLKWKKVAGATRYDYGRTPAVSDLNGDNNLEIVTYGNPGIHYAHLYIWDLNGNLLKDITVGKDMILTPPLVADIGEKIILVGASAGKPDPGTPARGFYAFDSLGNKLWQYPGIGQTVRTAHNTVGDIDGDNKDEAAVIVQFDNNAYKLVILDLEKTGASILWEKNIGSLIGGVAIEDIDNDGNNDVIIGSGKGVYAWDRDGTLIWSNPVPIVTNSPPSIGDINGDGIKDVVIGSDHQKQVYAISQGNMMPGFPVSTRMSVWSKPALFDINGDGTLEIVTGDYAGFVYGWNHKGVVLKGFPFKPSVKGFMSSPVIADLEGNGKFQIIMGNNDGNIYAWEYDYSDEISPVTTDDVDNLWHNLDVLVTLSAVDEGVGVDATYYTIDGSDPSAESSSGETISFSSDGIFTIKYFSIDKAGNVEPVKTAINNVKLDKIPPSTTDDFDGIWHNTDVTLTISAQDTVSGVTSLHYTVDDSSEIISESSEVSIAFTEDGVYNVKYYSTDNAGNIESLKSTDVKIDKTLPTTTDDSDGFWHNGDVTLTISALDALSGVNSLHYTIDGSSEIISESSDVSITFTDNGIHKIEYYSVDNAGNIEPAKTTQVKIDIIAPVTRDNSDSQWHNENIVVSLMSEDNLAGVYNTYYTVSPESQTIIDSFLSWFNELVSTETNEQTGNRILLEAEGIYNIKYYSVDNATNVEPEKTSNQVKIDKTLPIITVNTPQVTTYLHSDIITFGFIADDSLSGIKTVDASIDNAVAYDGQVFDMLSLDIGQHEFYVEASDNANNIVTKNVGFNVIATIDSVQALHERGVKEGWFKNKGIANSMAAKLNSAQRQINTGKTTSARNILQAYINELDAQINKNIDEDKAIILQNEAKYVIDSLL